MFLVSSHKIFILTNILVQIYNFKELKSRYVETKCDFGSAVKKNNFE